MQVEPLTSIQPPDTGKGAVDAGLRDAAKGLEAVFIAEMLKSAGLGETQGGFGGGAGEEQFSSFLVREQARAIAEAGGFGLAESIFDALVEQNRES